MNHENENHHKEKDDINENRINNHLFLSLNNLKKRIKTS